jgi:hypothetical protein
MPSANIVLTPYLAHQPLVDQFLVTVKVMHGDCVMFEDIDILCQDETEFLKVLNAKNTQPSDQVAYSLWCDENFQSKIPTDIIFAGLAKVMDVSGFYFDANGDRFKADLAP